MRARRREGAGEGGFTFLEVMVALVVLGVGLTAVATVFSMSLRDMSQAKMYEEARMRADDLMAQILAGRPDAGGGLPGGWTWTSGGGADPDRPGATLVEVEVSFPPGDRGRTLSLRTAQADMTLSPRTVSQGVAP